MVPALKSSAGGKTFGLFDYPEEDSIITETESLSSLESGGQRFLPVDLPETVIPSFTKSIDSDESILLPSISDILNKIPIAGDNSNNIISFSEQDSVVTVTTGHETTVEYPDSNKVSIYIIIPVVLVFVVMSTAFLYYLCRCMMRRKKRENQLATLTPKTVDPRMAGVRANQPIQFVVPTTIVVSENTEESVSETDYSSSGAKTLPIIMDRRKKRGFHINPEDLQHGLYVGVKAASEKGTFLGDLGKVGFSLSYSSFRNQLTVKLIGAADLPCHFLRTTANPCAKVVLLPDKTTKYMSKVQRNTMNPVFNESFVFSIRRDDLAEKRLKISVWDYDKFSRKCLIGQVIYAVKDSGLTNTSTGDAITGDIWVDLKPETSTHSSGVGEMLFSLCYNPDTANLTLTVLKARGLTMQLDKGKDLSVYAKVTLYVRRKLVRTKKTPTVRKTPEVEFNSSFDIHVPYHALGEVDLLVTLCEKGPGLAPRKIVGRTQVGGNCLCEQGLQHWQDMLLSPKSTCAQWHVLCES
ncbi:synaptotagmin-A [Trichonephila inaurata madagascariensis]|uniref:Synaptotagmin-A n=1 Tax=Trichonephila inaurata madagascariensis TaxID=2747483 RepID=A0A8X7BUL2_9ARAC|nr:synaptotagmin-A [Trichonephila inaurata madagascariensis]